MPPRPRRRRRSALWLVLALVLLALGGWIAGLGDLTGPLAPAPGIRFRHGMTRAETKREQARLMRLPAPPPVKQEAVDPLLTALGGTGGGFVLEANALWNEPVGQMLLKCLKARVKGARDFLEEAQQSVHLDPIQDVDRIAVGADHVAILSGFFQHVDFDAMFPDHPRVRYGQGGVIYEPLPGAGGSYADRAAVAVWRGQLFMVGMEDQVQAVIDQLEGRAPRAHLPILSGDTYGDAYGAIPGWLIANLLAGTNATLASRIRAQVRSAQVHLDAGGDLTLTARFYGRDGQSLDALERALAGALSAARLAAQAEGHPKVAGLLDDAQVVPTQSGFTLDVGVPRSWLDAALGKCQIFGSPPAGHP